jgi:hypothetical protein
METRANYLMIGGFILGALALIFIFVFWVANIAGGGNRYQIIFDSSVAGLTVGSRVGFNGIKVGVARHRFRRALGACDRGPRTSGRDRHRVDPCPAGRGFHPYARSASAGSCRRRGRPG